MVKAQTGYWVPVVWGWLPDKTETSYKVFFLLVEKKMNELGLQLRVESVLADFELNILKAVDVMLQCTILGCFFHFKTCIQRKADRNGFKTRYQTDEYFNDFINELSALSHLPIDDIEEGLEDINSRFDFNDDAAKTFKVDMVDYMNYFWIHGCIPPRVWNTFGRSDTLTNNNQEGYNSKFNKELKETHPSPGILLCHVKDQIILAEEKMVRVAAAVPKPAQRRAYKNLAKTRLRLKKNYLLARQNEEKDAISIFLRSMGHNVMSATMSGRNNEYEESQSQKAWDDNVDRRVSNWVPSNEDSVLEELSCEDNFNNRKIGVRSREPWIRKKCPSCHLGFNSKSAPIKCYGCDSFTHQKPSCFKYGTEKNNFYCKVCTLAEQRENPVQKAQTKNMHSGKVDGGFKCDQCSLVLKTKYNLNRHIERKHVGEQEENLNEELQESRNCPRNNTQSKRSVDIKTFLKDIGLEQYENIFNENDIDIEVLLDLRSDEFMDMSKELGIMSWAHRHKIKRAIEDRKAVVNVMNHVDDVGTSDNDETRVEIVSDGLEIEECELCKSSTQHKCRACNKQVCNLFCSIQDPNSDNESHRIHKHGDKRCATSELLPCSECSSRYETQDELKSHQEFAHSDIFSGNLEHLFECPTCNSTYSSPDELQKHILSTHEQESMLSLVSHSSSDSWMYVTCKTCDMKFKNDEDMNHHVVRVHEYGETCTMYPCEECGFQGQDIVSLQNHISEEHSCISEDETSDNLEDLGIPQLPVYSKRIKQTFPGLIIDDEGVIEAEDSDEEFTVTEVELTKRNLRKRKVTEALKPNKKSKQDNTSIKTKTGFICEICKATLSRKDSLTRHIKKMHS